VYGGLRSVVLGRKYPERKAFLCSLRFCAYLQRLVRDRCEVAVMAAHSKRTCNARCAALQQVQTPKSRYAQIVFERRFEEEAYWGKSMFEVHCVRDTASNAVNR
jgi:hypothetical protein